MIANLMMRWRSVFLKGDGDWSNRHDRVCSFSLVVTLALGVLAHPLLASLWTLVWWEQCVEEIDRRRERSWAGVWMVSESPHASYIQNDAGICPSKVRQEHERSSARLSRKCAIWGGLHAWVTSIVIWM